MLLLSKQFQVLREAHQIAQSLHVPTSSVEAADAEHTVIIEGFCDKVKGVEQTIVTKGNAGLAFRDMIVDLSERVDSSLSTAMASKSTSGVVLGDRLNLTRERDVVRRCTERSKKLRLQLNPTWVKPGSNKSFPARSKTMITKLPSAQISLLAGSKFPGGASVIRA